MRRLAPAGVLIGAAGFAASLTCVYSGMRNLMIESGGVCASGGPYEISSQCTDAQTGLLFGGIVAMLIFGALFAGASGQAGGSAMGAGFLMWGALFGALGFNFVQLGLDPPPQMSGGVGWIVSGVVFWLMALGGFWGAAAMLIEWGKRGGEPEQMFEAPIVRANVPRQEDGPPPGYYTPARESAEAQEPVVPKRIVMPTRDWEKDTPKHDWEQDD